MPATKEEIKKTIQCAFAHLSASARREAEGRLNHLLECRPDDNMLIDILQELSRESFIEICQRKCLMTWSVEYLAVLALRNPQRAAEIKQLLGEITISDGPHGVDEHIVRAIKKIANSPRVD